jgi:hypothetical protein
LTEVISENFRSVERRHIFSRSWAALREKWTKHLTSSAERYTAWVHSLPQWRAPWDAMTTTPKVYCVCPPAGSGTKSKVSEGSGRMQTQNEAVYVQELCVYKSRTPRTTQQVCQSEWEVGPTKVGPGWDWHEASQVLRAQNVRKHSLLGPCQQVSIWERESPWTCALGSLSLPRLLLALLLRS